MNPRLLLLSLTIVFAGACQTAQMRLAPSLASTQAFEVHGANPRRWGAPIRFGPWATSEAREGLT